MSSSKPTQVFADLLRARNTFTLADFLPVYVVGQQIGFVHRKYKVAVVALSPAIRSTQKGVVVDAAKDDYATLTQFFQTLNDALVQKGLLTPSHPGEMYRVTAARFSEPLFEMARYAAFFWGIRIFGVHLNGLVQQGKGQIGMWYAQRSKNRYAPGKFDHLVCGGQPSAITLRDNLCKEAYEEAKMPYALTRQAIGVGVVSSWEQRGYFLCRFTPVMFDLWLPETFEPISLDGSSSAFGTLSLTHLLQQPEMLFSFKSSCQPVLISLLLRHGYLQPDAEHYMEICIRLLKGFFPYTDAVY